MILLYEVKSRQNLTPPTYARGTPDSGTLTEACRLQTCNNEPNSTLFALFVFEENVLFTGNKIVKKFKSNTLILITYSSTLVFS